MRKLIPALIVLAFSVGCSVQNNSLQQRWPGSNGSPHNTHAISTVIQPGTPAAQSLQTPSEAEVHYAPPMEGPNVGQHNNQDPRVAGTTAGPLPAAAAEHHQEGTSQ